MASSAEICDSVKIKKYLSENKHDLSEVYAAHKKSLEICKEQITQWKKFIKDYNVLQEKLTTYPDKTSYEDLIPIGSLAFMKGRQIHTNEILVHLGENWFAERSVKDAIAIIIRRKEACEKSLMAAERNREIHEGWIKQTQFLAEEGEQVEIIEEMTEEEYIKSKEKHKEMIKKHFSMMGENAQETPNVSTLNEEMQSYEDLMKRLDVLAEGETITHELDESGEYDEDEDDDDDDDDDDDEEDKEEEAPAKGVNFKLSEKEGGVSPSGKEKLRRRVSWADQLTEPKHDDDEDEEEDEEGCVAPDTLRMKYRSRQQSLPTELISSSWSKDETSPSQDNEDEEGEEEKEEDAEGEAEGVTPQSPSDLYKMFGPHSLGGQPTKGILKKKGDSFQSDETEKGVGWSDTAESIEYIPCSPDEPVVFRNPPLSESPKEIKNLKPAFSYKVVARDEDEEEEEEEEEEEPQEASATTSVEKEEPKRISRFKALRMKKENEGS